MNVIVAVDQNWAIGKDGDQLVYLSEDLKRFKSLTTGHPVILGRKTLASVYRQLLPWCDTAYVTKIDRAFPADCHFPDLDHDLEWERTEESAPLEQDGIIYRYVTYRRKK